MQRRSRAERRARETPAEKEARRFDLNPASLFASETFKKVARITAQTTRFSRRSATKIAPRKLLTRLVPQDELKEKPPASGMASVVRRVLGAATGATGEDKIKVSGTTI